MVAGRAAEREGEAIAGIQPVGACDRAAHGGDRRLVGALGDRGIGGIGVVADRADDIVGYTLAGAANGKGIGDRLCCKTGRHPAVPDGGEKIQIGGIMHFSSRFQSMRIRCHDIGKTRLLDRRQDPFGAKRRLEGRHQLAGVQFGPGIAQLVILGIDDAHFRSCP